MLSGFGPVSGSVLPRLPQPRVPSQTKRATGQVQGFHSPRPEMAQTNVLSIPPRASHTAVVLRASRNSRHNRQEHAVAQRCYHKQDHSNDRHQKPRLRCLPFQPTLQGRSAHIKVEIKNTVCASASPNLAYQTRLGRCKPGQKCTLNTWANSHGILLRPFSPFTERHIWSHPRITLWRQQSGCCIKLA